jgi:hypothetical protein
VRSLVHTPTGEPLAHDQHALPKPLPITMQCAQSDTQNPLDAIPAANGQKRTPAVQPAQERTEHVSPQHAPPQLCALQALEASCSASGPPSSPASGETTSDIASRGATSGTTSLELASAEASGAPEERPVFDRPHAMGRTDTAIDHVAPTRMSRVRRTSRTNKHHSPQYRAAQGSSSPKSPPIVIVSSR